ncbi:hypothetical protein VPFG_00322 [Vibrio phage nt-1]|uniref:Uncharacterized protein n=1 Tax=Vibrio phage nt-1 TaxID=115992 RepID=R9TIV6_9CAUD|nr:hypothetical protein VPFG_00322 [Vibrio phage nt-1]AGN30320.1 hypothetical protein VPFG_00322 [Vibrio phage nt-1]
MLGIGGGIYTFLQDHIRLMKSYNCDVKVIIFGDDKCPHMSSWDFGCDFVLTNRAFNDYKANALVIKSLSDDTIIYTHSYEALRACIEANRACYNQHHFGDLIVPDSYKQFMDINRMYNLNQWRAMMGKSALVTNVAQSDGIRYWGEQIMGGKHVTAYEPFELPEVSHAELNNAKESDVIIVSGAYKRKQIPEMLKTLVGSDLSVQLFTTDFVSVPQGVNCKVHIKKPREEVIAHMMKSKVLLHMSHIEIMPYAVVEASQHIPCIVQYDAPYTRDFIFPVVRADINNDTIVDVIEKATSEQYEKFDIEKYRQDTKTHWETLWGLKHES